VLSTDPDHTSLREDVLRQLWKLYPQHCVVMTDPRSRLAIDVGIGRAARHGFREAAHVRPFLGLMVFLGSHFDEDPQLAWARESLQRSASASRGSAMGDLLGETTRRMQPIIGRRGGHYRRALARSRALGFETLAAIHDDSDSTLHGVLRQLYRRKYERLGDAVIEPLLLATRSAAQHHGLTTPPGLVVYLVLVFLLGSGIDRDPFHPWVGETLMTPTDPTTKARALHRRAIETLRRFTRLDELMRANAPRG